VKEEVATPKALKKRWSMKKRRSWRRSWPKKRSSAMLGGGSQPAGGAEAGGAGGAERLERAGGQSRRLHLRPSQRHLNSPARKSAG
jgi:hypothetical protein